MTKVNSERPTPSAITSGLTVLETTGQRVEGVIAERVYAPRCEEFGSRFPPPNRHIVGVHNSAPFTLRWRQDQRVCRRRMVPGDAIICPSGSYNPHATDANVSSVLVSFALDAPQFRGTQARLRPDWYARDAMVAHLARNLASAFTGSHAAASLYADTLAHALAVHLTRYYADGPPQRDFFDCPPLRTSQRALGEVCDYIDAHLAEVLTVNKLAAVAGLSPTHFNRTFRDQIGEPPHRYVHGRRLDRAQKLIVTTTLPLAMVAAQAGFSDQSHLNRVMRAEHDITPGELRRTAR